MEYTVEVPSHAVMAPLLLQGALQNRGTVAPKLAKQQWQA